MTQPPKNEPEVRAPEPVKAKAPSSQSVVRAAVAFSGPLPPPEILAGYDGLLPGAAERILRMAEQQSEHRREMEKTVIEAGARDSLAGIIAGVLVALAIIAVAGYSVHKGNVVAGSLLGGTTAAAIVGAFVYGTRSNKQERESRRGERPN